ncbi:MAG TPA: citrate synthase [Thermodesulfovibrionales bacterium]|nr:citrate synthase [Thermodesulfovibrionales bacterium]
MDRILKKVQELALLHDKVDPRIVKEKNIKLGLRNEDGTGVFVGITSKGQVIGYEKVAHGDGTEQVNPVPGKLFYCGYDVVELVREKEKENRFGFEETVYLLLTGELPSMQDLKAFSQLLGKRRELPIEVKQMILNRPCHNDQMGSLHTIVSAMHLFDIHANSTDMNDVTRQCIELIAKFPTIIAYNYLTSSMEKKSLAKLREPDPELSMAENFLHLLLGEVPERNTAELFDTMLIFHAEHGGGNNSTFSTRCVSSSGANSYMALCAGIGSLSGHLHGGANEAVVKMIRDIKQRVKDWESDDEVTEYLELILDKKAGDRSGKIYGLGHAVYTISDPRAIFLEDRAGALAKAAGQEKEFSLYKRIARIAPRLVKERKGKVVCTNVDFYSGFVYQCMGIPMDLFTPIFALARVAGWSAHRIEEIVQGRIIRPSYVTSLKGKKTYVPLASR